MSFNVEEIKVMANDVIIRTGGKRGFLRLIHSNRLKTDGFIIEGLAVFEEVKKVAAKADTPEDIERKRRLAVKWLQENGAYDYSNRKMANNKYPCRCKYCGTYKDELVIQKFNKKEIVLCGKCNNLLFKKGVHCWYCKNLEVWVEGDAETGETKCDCIKKHKPDRTVKGCINYNQVNDIKAGREAKVYPEGRPDGS